MTEALARSVRAPADQDHADGGKSKRNCRNEADLEVAEAAEALEDLRHPERESVAAGLQYEVDESESPDEWLCKRGANANMMEFSRPLLLGPDLTHEPGLLVGMQPACIFRLVVE